MGNEKVDPYRNPEGRAMRKKLTPIMRQDGFTLIELAIVLAIIPILAVAVAVPLIKWPQMYANIQADREMAEQARNAIQWMGRDIRQAASVLPRAGSFKTSPSDTLVLAVPEGAEAKVVVWSCKEGVLSRTEFADPLAEKPLDRMPLALPKASFLLNWDADPPATTWIEVSIDLNRSVMDKDREFSLSGKFWIRKKNR